MGIPASIGRQQYKMLKEISKGIISIFDIVELDRANATRNIKKLEERGLIVNLGGEKVEVTEAGLELLGNFEKIDIYLKKEKSWDGVWHLIAYDIPEEFKKERNYFQKKLKDLGLIKIQNSLWLYPFNCKEEIAVFSQSIGVNPFVIYMKTEHVPGDSKYRERFSI